MNLFRECAKKCLRLALGTFNFFYIPIACSSVRRKINRFSDKRQIFFISRMDFGIFLYILNYIRCWEEKRGETALVILTPHHKPIEALAKHICPQTTIICTRSFILRLVCMIFGERRVNASQYLIQSILEASFPFSLHLYDSTPLAFYNAYFDHRLKADALKVSPNFLKGYQSVRKYLNYREDVLLDYYHIHQQCGLSRREYATQALNTLRKNLGISSSYVVLNLNCKKYKGGGNSIHRSISHPKRYNSLIDKLIEKDFNVVVQGRNEQPVFKSRKGLIDYAHSPYCTVENDLALYSGSQFAIVNKTGPDCFCPIVNTPLLGLDYVELTTTNPHIKLRFFPKHVYDNNLGRRLTWKEYLSSPTFFDIATHKHDPQVTHEDLEEEELLMALDEFLPMVNQPEKQWYDYSPEQITYRNFLHPLHLDLYEIKSVPCNVYLRNSS